MTAGRLRWQRWSAAALACLGLACGGVMYSLRLERAADALARAEQLGAAQRAPYEYHFALEHLREARAQAARAEYGDAERLATTAREYAERALQLAQRVERATPATSILPAASKRPAASRAPVATR